MCPNIWGMDIEQFYEGRLATTVIVGIRAEASGRILSASSSFCELLGAAPRALVGSSILEFVHPDDRDRARHEFAQLVSGVRATYDGVGRVLAPRGAVHWVTVHASVTWGGEPEGLLINAYAMPVRLLPAKDANERRTSSTDRLGVALDFEPLESSRVVA